MAQSLIFLVFFVIFVVLKYTLKGTGAVLSAGASAFDEVFNDSSKKSSYNSFSNSKYNPALDSMLIMLVAASNHVKAASSAQKRILKRDIINHTADQFVNALNNHNAKAKYQEHLYSVIDKAENTDLSIFEAAQNLMQYNLDHDTIVNIFGQVVSLIRIDDEAGTKRDELSKLATNFYHINNSKVQNVLDMIYGEQSHSKSSSSNATSAELDQCYKVLGCSNFDSDEKIKKAYRELSRKFHPDYIQGKDLHEDFLSFATSKMQEINMAYEKIKNARGSF